MGERLFAAVLLPTDVRDEVETMVSPRRDDAWRWVDPSDWHITLAFYGDVEPWRYETLTENLERVAGKTSGFPVSIAGVGCFASVAKAHVLYGAVDDPLAALPPLGRRCRTAATTGGVEVARATFHPHLTLARRNRAGDGSKWIRALMGLESRAWQVSDIALVQSFLGQGSAGRPRYEVRQTFALEGS